MHPCCCSPLHVTVPQCGRRSMRRPCRVAQPAGHPVAPSLATACSSQACGSLPTQWTPLPPAIVAGTSLLLLLLPLPLCCLCCCPTCAAAAACRCCPHPAAPTCAALRCPPAAAPREAGVTPGGPWARTSNPWGPRGPEVRLLPAGVPLLLLLLLWLLLWLLLPHPCCLVIGRSQRCSCCTGASCCRQPCTVAAARTIVASARRSSLRRKPTMF